jgi:hypothetical protein
LFCRPLFEDDATFSVILLILFGSFKHRHSSSVQSCYATDRPQRELQIYRNEKGTLLKRSVANLRFLLPLLLSALYSVVDSCNIISMKSDVVSI